MDIFQEVLKVVDHVECSHEVELLREEVERKVEQARLLSDLAGRLIEEAREDEARIASIMKTLPCVMSMVDYDAPGMRKRVA